ncbi:hypothetical protein FHW83_003464 [Duganella sp. SG902]|uniref:hypothetical protein n=1 Tax=Duganella sp. SG902 TaxID=2587016 RepID=UPI00159DCF08|nr:hypothetical protein [Duganella sp. SG902]NVM77646.1 hypothetical protein [Duganella sp. SG902]
MTPAELRAWRTLLGVKQRAIDRLRRTLAGQRAALAAAEADVDACAGQLRRGGAALEEHAARQAQLLAGPGLSPLLYLDYEAWRGRLVEQQAAAQAAFNAAEQIVLDKQRLIGQTLREIGGVSAQRDGIAARLAAGALAVDLAQQDAQDEESGETSVARLLARRRQAQAEAA